MLKIDNELCKEIKTDCINKYTKKARYVALKEIKKILECKMNGDFSPMFTTGLYQNNSGVYCALLCSVSHIVD